jgi:hypothetical protein
MSEIPEACCYGGDHPAEKYMSGSPICWRHWYWLKLDLPAANHWERVAREFLSNVDTWDITQYFVAAGLNEDEMATMLTSARKILSHSEKVKEGLQVKV